MRRFIPLLSFLALCSGAFPAWCQGADQETICESTAAGAQYPADKDALRETLAHCLDDVPTPPLDGVRALILPHAAYRWSGRVAGYGMHQVAGDKQFSRVVVLGPSHQGAPEGRGYLPDCSHFETPLGLLPLDAEMMKTLAASPLFAVDARLHGEEHSIQTIVPLLQAALGEVPLVPVLVGQADFSTAHAMAQTLLAAMGPNALVIVSSDFTHYGPDHGYVPFTEDLPKALRNLDMGCMNHILARDLRGYQRYVHETGITVCGHHPLAVLMAMLPPTAQGHILRYDTSGRMRGNYGNSVSYMSVAFQVEWPKASAPAARVAQGGLNEKSRDALLAIARAALEWDLPPEALAARLPLDLAAHPELSAPGAVFVTLREDGRLRGCMGDTVAARPLWESAAINAARAARQDSRFPSLKPEEAEGVDIVISILSRPEAVAEPGEIEVGRHGVIFRKGAHRSVFLPERIIEQGWDREALPRQLAIAAGLSSDAWTGAVVQVFETESFGETDGRTESHGQEQGE